jgi:hypothetical protein
MVEAICRIRSRDAFSSTGMPFARAAAAANSAGGCSWQAKHPLFLKN